MRVRDATPVGKGIYFIDENYAGRLRSSGVEILLHGAQQVAKMRFPAALPFRVPFLGSVNPSPLGDGKMCIRDRKMPG